MSIGKAELGSDFQVTLEAGFRILAWIDDQSDIAAGTDMQAAGTMAGFASGIFCVFAAGLQAGVVCSLEITGDHIMAIGTGLGADKSSPRNVWRGHNGLRQSFAGNQSYSHNDTSTGDPEKFGSPAIEASAKK